MKRNKKTANVLCFAAMLLCAAAVLWSGCQGANDPKKDIENGNTGTKILIKYDEKEIRVERKTGSDSYTYLPSGSEVSIGTSLFVYARNLPDGKQVDKWKVNTKELTGDKYTVEVADAVTEGTEKVITVTYTQKTAAALIVQFDENTITVHKTGGKRIYSGNTVYEGHWMRFRAINLPDGQQVDKWKVNGTELAESGYTINTSHAVTEGGQQIIKVTYTTKAAEAIVVRFNESEIEVHKHVSGKLIHNGDTIYEGHWIVFRAINLPAGQQLDKWKVNDKKRNGNLYAINSSDAVTEGGQKVITVTYTLKAAEAVVIKFDKSKIDVKKESKKEGGEHIQDGGTVYEGTHIWFQLANLAEGIPAGQTFDEWTINGREHNGNAYTVNLADAVTEGSQKVIRIAYTTKPGSDPVVIKFDPNFVYVHHRGADTSVKNGQTLYAGTELRFRKPKVVKTINKWLINTKEYEDKPFIYSIDPADAVEENGQKVLRISFTVKTPQTLTVQFTPAGLIEGKTIAGQTISSGYEGPAYLYTILTAKLSPGQKVKHWEINGQRISGSEGLQTLEGQVNPDFAVDEGGKKVVKVNLVVE